ncbi:MAG: hypothetical protein R3Y27_02555 [Clostridia bacterium]
MSETIEIKKDEQSKKKLVIIILLIITLLAASVTTWAVFFRADVEISPDYAPVELEPNAEILEDSGEDKLESPDGGGAVSISYSLDVSIDLSTDEVSLFFQNPSESNQDIVLQIVIQDVVVAQSGRLEAGYGVTTLDLLDSAVLSAGIYDGDIVALYYDTETGEKAMVNTEIPVEIVVS